MGKYNGHQRVVIAGSTGGLATVDSSGALLISGNITTTPSTAAIEGATQYDEDVSASTWVGTLAFFVDSSNKAKAIRATTPLPVDPSDKALRDLGKVDVAAFDQYTPVDTDSAGGTENSLPVAIRFTASGGGAVCPGDGTLGMKVQSTAISLAPSTHAVGKLAAQDSTGVNIGKVKVYGNSTAIIQGTCTVVSTQVSLAPSTHAIGKLAANAGITIGTVDSTTISLAPSTHAIGKLAANVGVEIGNVTIAGNCTVVSTSISLASSTHAIGKLASNTGVTIGTVDVATFTHGLSMKSAAGACSSAADNTLATPAAGKAIVVTGYSLTTDAALTGLTASFLSGRGGTELWRVRLQHPSSGMAGANLAVAAPGELFRTAANAALSLSLSTAGSLHYGVAYWEA